MTIKRKFKGRSIECPNCKSLLKASWLSGMNSDISFMYSGDSKTILVGSHQDLKENQRVEFDFDNPLRCPKCSYTLRKRSSEPSRDRAIFLESMTYVTGDKEYDVEVVT